MKLFQRTKKNAKPARCNRRRPQVEALEERDLRAAGVVSMAGLGPTQVNIPSPYHHDYYAVDDTLWILGSGFDDKIELKVIRDANNTERLELKYQNTAGFQDQDAGIDLSKIRNIRIIGNHGSDKVTVDATNLSSGKQFHFEGGDGFDYFEYSGDQPCRANGGKGNDTLHGGNGADVLMGDTGYDQLHGNGGRDTLYGGADSDYLSGGADADTLYGDAGWGGYGLKSGQRQGNDNIVGGSGNDYLDGGGGHDWLDGGADSDRLFGGAGQDVLNGGSFDGALDYLNGGADFDTFVVRNPYQSTYRGYWYDWWGTKPQGYRFDVSEDRVYDSFDTGFNGRSMIFQGSSHHWYVSYTYGYYVLNDWWMGESKDD